MCVENLPKMLRNFRCIVLFPSFDILPYVYVAFDAKSSGFVREIICFAVSANVISGSPKFVFHASSGILGNLIQWLTFPPPFQRNSPKAFTNPRSMQYFGSVHPLSSRYFFKQRTFSPEHGNCSFVLIR